MIDSGLRLDHGQLLVGSLQLYLPEGRVAMNFGSFLGPEMDRVEGSCPATFGGSSNSWGGFTMVFAGGSNPKVAGRLKKSTSTCSPKLTTHTLCF